MQRKNEAHEIVLESFTEALLQLMEKKPLAQINVTELCNRAGVSRISFYRNYAKIEDILVKHMSKCTEVWYRDFSKSDSKYFYENFLSELLEQYTKNKKLILLLNENNATYVLKDHIFGCCDPSAESDDRAAYERAVLAGAIYGLVDEWIKRGMGKLPEGFSIRKLSLEAKG